MFSPIDLKDPLTIFSSGPINSIAMKLRSRYVGRWRVMRERLLLRFMEIYLLSELPDDADESDHESEQEYGKGGCVADVVEAERLPEDLKCEHRCLHPRPAVCEQQHEFEDFE